MLNKFYQQCKMPWSSWNVCIVTMQNESIAIAIATSSNGLVHLSLLLPFPWMVIHRLHICLNYYLQVKSKLWPLPTTRENFPFLLQFSMRINLSFRLILLLLASIFMYSPHHSSIQMLILLCCTVHGAQRNSNNKYSSYLSRLAASLRCSLQCKITLVCC